MQAEFYYSATPFKVLPKQSTSDTVISHTLPVHCRGNDADTNGNMCTNVGGTNSQHRHTTLALSVHPTSRLKRPRQAPINKIMRRRKNNFPAGPSGLHSNATNRSVHPSACSSARLFAPGLSGR
ncbi:hypothetical protein TcCL_NonESM00364 [Trypanosoma cruzi]|nr:hypothetical protein TcCL_NonESM00364 [Trypanosoma cruzi]